MAEVVFVPRSGQTAYSTTTTLIENPIYFSLSTQAFADLGS
jgi:hypothetical protein